MAAGDHLTLCIRKCHPDHSSNAGIRVVWTSNSIAFLGFQVLTRAGTVLATVPIPAAASEVRIEICRSRTLNGFARTIHASPSSRLTVSVLSGAICSSSVPLGTLNPKKDEYAILPYFASLARWAFVVPWPDESRKWWLRPLHRICRGGQRSLTSSSSGWAGNRRAASGCGNSFAVQKE